MINNKVGLTFSIFCLYLIYFFFFFFWCSILFWCLRCFIFFCLFWFFFFFFFFNYWPRGNRTSNIQGLSWLYNNKTAIYTWQSILKEWRSNCHGYNIFHVGQNWLSENRSIRNFPGLCLKKLIYHTRHCVRAKQHAGVIFTFRAFKRALDKAKGQNKT